MRKKRLYTRKEFESIRIKWANAMAGDSKLRQMAINVLVKADGYNWIHQTTWLGEPILNLPQDMFAIQEIIYRTKPTYIIECGVAWGGALLFYATLMEILKKGRIIGIDVYIPDDLKRRIGSHEALSKRIKWIKGSSVEKATLLQAKSMIKGCRDVMVILDSYHTHDHVLRELRLYSAFVGKGHYIVCGDTVVEDIPKQTHRPRPWGPGNNPKTALREFLSENGRFELDKELDSKLLLSCNPGGYLRCCKD